jgi:hypothetical protein
MFHVKQATLLAIICMQFIFGFSQQGVYTYKPVVVNLELPDDTALLNGAERQAKLFGLSAFEQNFIYNLNYCRTHPLVFMKKAVVPYLDAYPQWRSKYGESLVRDLETLSNLNTLLAESRLFQIARAHAADLAKHNVMSHASSDGTTTQQRFQKIGINCGTECINMGNYPNALEVLLSLLIDYGVANFGHRKSLLSPTVKMIGIGAVRNAAGDVQYTVADLSCD